MSVNKRDYYEVLEIPRDVDAAGLKAAFRKAAIQCHPDKNPGDAAAEARFKEINEANTVLSNPDKRAAYDRFGHRAEDSVSTGGYPSSSGNPAEDEAIVLTHGMTDGYTAIYNKYRRDMVMLGMSCSDTDLVDAIKSNPVWAAIRLNVILADMKGNDAVYCSEDMRSLFREYIPDVYEPKIFAFYYNKYAVDGRKWFEETGSDGFIEARDLAAVIDANPTRIMQRTYTLFEAMSSKRIARSDGAIWKILLPYIVSATVGKAGPQIADKANETVILLVQEFNKSPYAKTGDRLLALAQQSPQISTIIRQHLADKPERDKLAYAFADMRGDYDSFNKEARERQSNFDAFKEALDGITRSTTKDAQETFADAEVRP